MWRIVIRSVLQRAGGEGQADFPAMLDFMRARGFRFVEFVSERRMPPLDEHAVFVKQSGAARR